MNWFRTLALGAVFLVSAEAVAASKSEDRHRVHTVYPGQTLGKIAKRYNLSIETLCRANGVQRRAPLQPGQRLLIPENDDDPIAELKQPRSGGDRWQSYAAPPKRRGLVTLESPTKKWRGVVFDRRGKVSPKSVDGLEHMFASWRTGHRHPIDPRLIRLLVEVSDTFGGRPIRVVSGYREHSFAVESKHKVGRALDFSIPGVPNSVLKDYLRTLRDVGVGFYPHSTHVHLDVREVNTYWVDNSAPGQPPQYTNRPHGGQNENPAPAAEAAEAESEGESAGNAPDGETPGVGAPSP